MAEEVSDRLVDQRVRNRVIEVLEVLADGVAGLFALGGKEYFNLFFDYIDDDFHEDWRTLSTYTAAEVDKLEAVLAVILEALDGTAGLDIENEIAASGWPARVEPIARDALAAMLGRGRFDGTRTERSFAPIGPRGPEHDAGSAVAAESSRATLIGSLPPPRAGDRSGAATDGAGATRKSVRVHQSNTAHRGPTRRRRSLLRSDRVQCRK